MSRTCHEEIARVKQGRYEDASDLSATSRECRAPGIGQKGSTTPHAADRRQTNLTMEVSAWLAER